MGHKAARLYFYFSIVLNKMLDVALKTKRAMPLNMLNWDIDSLCLEDKVIEISPPFKFKNTSGRVIFRKNCPLYPQDYFKFVEHTGLDQDLSL